MSNIGSNIKKLRTLKKISQAEFAKLFDLARPSIGAYEEGRAEPKIETVIQIAKHFGLSIDILLTKELTTNELYSFDILNERLNKAHKFIPSAKSARRANIGLVNTDKYVDYIVSHNNRDFISNLPAIELPTPFRGTARAFELNGSEMEYHQNGLHHGDILLCQLKSHSNLSNKDHGLTYLVVTENFITTRRLNTIQSKVIEFITDDPNYPPMNLELEKVLELWEVKGVFSTYLNPPKLLDEKVLLLEKRLNVLESLMNKKK